MARWEKLSKIISWLPGLIFLVFLAYKALELNRGGRIFMGFFWVVGAIFSVALILPDEGESAYKKQMSSFKQRNSKESFFSGAKISIIMLCSAAVLEFLMAFFGPK